MSIPNLFEIPTMPKDPLSYATQKRNEPIINTVRRAIEKKHVMLAYQPIVSAKHPDRPAFYEGLIRIIDELQEVIPAKNFISVVENMELGRILDCHALELGLTALAEEPSLRLSINMSARSIGYTPWLEILEKGLKANSTVAERLILEITEESAITVPELLANFINNLRKRGISFALDDFGAGYTAFRFFKQFQFDILKIDGQFIRGIHNDADNQVLTSALMSIAKQFDMLTVAEHIENQNDMDYLINAGIDCLQGYHVGMPEIVPEWTQSIYRNSISA